MYKLVAIDLDGTLLNSKGLISEKNKNAIKKAQENGIEVILASGRSKDSVKNFALEINSNKYLIAGNGALAYDIQKNKDIYDFVKTKKYSKTLSSIIPLKFLILLLFYYNF